jgi:hypothetical protein
LHKGEKNNRSSSTRRTKLHILTAGVLLYSSIRQTTANSVFICLLERILDFFLTATKSRKLQNEEYKFFLDNVIKAICEEGKFLQILDSQGGHTNNLALYEKFLDQTMNHQVTENNTAEMYTTMSAHLS